MAQPVAQDPQIGLLQYQMQQCLNQLNPGRFSVRKDIAIDDASGFQPALSVFEFARPDLDPVVRWAISIVYTDSSVADDKADDRQSRLCAGLAIADYWLLTPSQSQLRTYSNPGASGYQQHQLWHVGKQVSPTSIPDIALRLQEPLPLYFLTRTLKGQRTYTSSALPLRVC